LALIGLASYAEATAAVATGLQRSGAASAELLELRAVLADLQRRPRPGPGPGRRQPAAQEQPLPRAAAARALAPASAGAAEPLEAALALLEKAGLALPQGICILLHLEVHERCHAFRMTQQCIATGLFYTIYPLWYPPLKSR
jgi:hypothetical protein